MIQNVFYRIQHANAPYYVMSVHIPWRKMPYVLDRLADQTIDIRKAHIRPTYSTLYMKREEHALSIKEIHDSMNETIFDGYHDSYTRQKHTKIVLPKNTKIQLYTIPDIPNTTLEFTCSDRIGLLADMMDLMVQFPYEMEHGYISTVGPYAHNMFFLQKNGKSLDKNDREYISNVFEYEVKNHLAFSNDSHPSE